MSIHCAKACVGVAVKKGFGAEGGFVRKSRSGSAENIRSAVVAENRTESYLLTFFLKSQFRCADVLLSNAKT